MDHSNFKGFSMRERLRVKVLRQLILASEVFPCTDCCPIVGRVRCFWRRKKGQSKVTTEVSTTCCSQCVRQARASPSQAIHPLYMPGLVCNSTALEKLCFLHIPGFACFPPLSAEKSPNPDIVSVNYLNMDDLKYF